MNLGIIWGNLGEAHITLIENSILKLDNKYFAIIQFKQRYKYIFIPLDTVEAAIESELKWMENLSETSTRWVLDKNQDDIGRAYYILLQIKTARMYDSNYTTMPG